MLNLFRLPRRITLTPLTFALYLTLYFVLVLNLPFWISTWQAIQSPAFSKGLLLGSVFVFLSCFVGFCFCLLIWRPWAKPLAILFILLGSLSQYFFWAYRIYIDDVMLANLVETHSSEVTSMITVPLVVWLLLSVAVPAYLIHCVQWRKDERLHWALLKRAGAIAALFLACGAAVFPFYKDYAAIGRNNRMLVKLIAPVNVINASYGYAKDHLVPQPTFQLIGEDAVTQPSSQPRLLVLVLGETTRAQNLSLNGYPRQTMPHLSKRSGIINFEQVSSCGTATATSVPCMFSNMPRKQYDASKAKYQDNLLDIAQRAGYRVLWRENDGGCKGVCDRVPNEKAEVFAEETPAAQELYYDDILLNGLDHYLGPTPQNTLIVLHTNGSHGPEYYKRYRPDLPNKFTPECLTNAIETCDQQALVNTYDNTVLNVDLLLDNTLNWLQQQQPNYQVSLLYVSDHGESLGEKGMYLHSAPYAIAPQEQTHIPLIFWADAASYADNYVDARCLAQQARAQDFSHDNLFHSILSWLRIKTDVYDPELDWFNPCRPPVL